MPTTLTIAGMTLVAISVFAQVQRGTPGVDGRVIDQTGAGIADATIVASGAGFDGWATTGPDGSFHLKAAGQFISVRGKGRKARLLRTSELTKPVLIVLEAATGDDARKMPACGSLPRVGGRWIGGGLKVNPGRRGRSKGPVNGEHDSHWYVAFGKDSLHIVDGYAWHAGLPQEAQLASSETISVHSWEFNHDVIGLDLAGRTKDGKRWRWLGAPIATAIEYGGAGSEAGEFFDEVMKSACFGSSVPGKK